MFEMDTLYHFMVSINSRFNTVSQWDHLQNISSSLASTSNIFYLFIDFYVARTLCKDSRKCRVDSITYRKCFWGYQQKAMAVVLGLQWLVYPEIFYPYSRATLCSAWYSMDTNYWTSSPHSDPSIACIVTTTISRYFQYLPCTGLSLVIMNC